MNQNLDRNRPPVLNMTVGSRKSGKCNSMASREDASGTSVIVFEFRVSPCAINCAKFWESSSSPGLFC
jgi:hypothetical protein